MAAQHMDQLPTVTIDDLKRYHAVHLPHTPVPEISIEASSEVSEHLEEGEVTAGPDEEAEDDDLGYYPDGVKRTLTDEQIAIFRHSEIQVLLRERRQREEAAAIAAEEEEEGESGEVRESSGEQARGTKRDAAAASTGASYHDNSRSAHGNTGKRRKKNRKPRPPKGERRGGEDALIEHHKARMLQSLHDTDEQGEEEDDYTPRRIARELDEVKATSLEIDYG